MQNQPKSRESFWTILKLLKWAAAYFKSHHIENPRATAEVLLAHTLRKERIDLYVCYDQPLGSEELQHFKTLIKKRIEREPVAYITGGKEFWSIELRVNPDVLILVRKRNAWWKPCSRSFPGIPIQHPGAFWSWAQVPGLSSWRWPPGCGEIFFLRRTVRSGRSGWRSRMRGVISLRTGFISFAATG